MFRTNLPDYCSNSNVPIPENLVDYCVELARLEAMYSILYLTVTVFFVALVGYALYNTVDIIIDDKNYDKIKFFIRKFLRQKS